MGSTNSFGSDSIRWLLSNHAAGAKSVTQGVVSNRRQSIETLPSKKPSGVHPLFKKQSGCMPKGAESGSHATAK